jgi:hypothetical protein
VHLRFTRSALRHGISPERIAYVIEHCLHPLFDPAWFDVPDGVLFLGLDRQGVPLEVLAVERPDGDMLVIHAMRMRPRFAVVLVEGLR